MFDSRTAPTLIVFPLPAHALASRQARELLDLCLEQWRLPHLYDTAALVAAELVTNALASTLRAGLESFTLSLSTDGTSIRVEVWDPCDGVPTQREPEEMSEHGRGLGIVDALAKEWGVREHAEGGKTVHAVIA